MLGRITSHEYDETCLEPERREKSILTLQKEVYTINDTCETCYIEVEVHTNDVCQNSYENVK